MYNEDKTAEYCRLCGRSLRSTKAADNIHYIKSCPKGEISLRNILTRHPEEHDWTWDDQPEYVANFDSHTGERVNG